MNEPEIRPTTNVIISRSNAYEFLANSKSELENITAKYYEIIATSSSSTGFTSNITLADVITGFTDTFGEATGILGSVAASSKESPSSEENPEYVSDTDTIAGESTSDSNTDIQSSTNIDVVGLAAFKGDIMVGELTGEETICHLIITNKLDECIFSIPSPFDEEKTIDLSIAFDDKTEKKVDIVNGSPYINIDVKLRARILSVSRSTDYFNNDNLSLVENYANSYVKGLLDEYLYKTSKEFKSDIASFGKYAVIHFSTWDKWIEYNWLDNYSNSFFNTNVDVDITSGYLVS